MNTRTDTNANFPATHFYRYLTHYFIVCHQWQAVTKLELDVISTRFDFLEIICSNKGSQRGTSEAANW